MELWWSMGLPSSSRASPALELSTPHCSRRLLLDNNLSLRTATHGRWWRSRVRCRIHALVGPVLPQGRLCPAPDSQIASASTRDHLWKSIYWGVHHESSASQNRLFLETTFYNLRFRKSTNAGKQKQLPMKIKNELTLLIIGINRGGWDSYPSVRPFSNRLQNIFFCDDQKCFLVVLIVC